jgi:hypothetical protein
VRPSSGRPRGAGFCLPTRWLPEGSRWAGGRELSGPEGPGASWSVAWSDARGRLSVGSVACLRGDSFGACLLPVRLSLTRRSGTLEHSDGSLLPVESFPAVGGARRCPSPWLVTPMEPFPAARGARRCPSLWLVVPWEPFPVGRPGLARPRARLPGPEASISPRRDVASACRHSHPLKRRFSGLGLCGPLRGEGCLAFALEPRVRELRGVLSLLARGAGSSRTSASFFIVCVASNPMAEERHQPKLALPLGQSPSARPQHRDAGVPRRHRSGVVVRASRACRDRRM